MRLLRVQMSQAMVPATAKTTKTTGPELAVGIMAEIYDLSP
jgi:hypothetical protein